MIIFPFYRLPIITGFFVFLFFIFFSSSLSFAKEDGEEERSCVDELIYSVSTVEIEFEDELEKFLDLRSSQVEAKTKSVPFYLQNYQCQLEYVCQVFENPVSASSSAPDHSSPLCGSFNGEKFLKKNSINFEICEENTGLLGKKDRLLLCQNFIALKKKSSLPVSEEKIIKQSALENQAFLSAKLQGLQARMGVLYEKTRLFVRNFNKVISDISCAIPDKSA